MPTRSSERSASPTSINTRSIRTPTDDTINISVILQVLPRRHRIVKTVRIECKPDHHAGAGKTDIVPENTDFPGIGPEQAEEYPDSGSLPGAVRAEIAKDITAFDIESDSPSVSLFCRWPSSGSRYE